MFLICLSLINNFSQITNGSEECSIKVSDVLDVSNYNAKDIYLIDKLLCLTDGDELLPLLSNVSIIWVCTDLCSLIQTIFSFQTSLCNNNEVNLDGVFEAIDQIESRLEGNWSNEDMIQEIAPDLSMITM